MKGQSDHRDLRRWVGDVDTEGGEMRWVVWGDGAAPDPPEGAATASDVAYGFIEGLDEGWGQTAARWAFTVTADDATIDELVETLPGVRGVTPYLAAGKTDETDPRPMRGTLRSDVGPRRKADQPRPS